MKRHIGFLAVFAGVLAVAQLAFWCGPHRDFSALEKRYLADAPPWSLSRVASGKWMEGAEAYVTDHFPARDALVGLDAGLRQAAGLNAVGQIYRGQEDWLIAAPLTADGAQLTRNLQAIRSFAQASGCPAALLAVPTTGAVETAMLPRLHDAYPDAAWLEQVQALADDGFAVPDLLTVFTRHADVQALYYRTDHHWTTAGAYTAYTAWCTATGRTPAPQERFTVSEHSGFYGTSYAKSGLWHTPPDALALWEDPTLPVQVTVWDADGSAPVQQDSLYFRSHLDEPDQYPVFLDGNHGRVRIQTGRSGGRLLVVRDSFAHCLAPFLAEHFSQIDLIDLRYFKQQSVSAYLAANPADEILFCYGMDSLATDRTLQALA